MTNGGLVSIWNYKQSHNKSIFHHSFVSRVRHAWMLNYSHSSHQPKQPCGNPLPVAHNIAGAASSSHSLVLWSSASRLASTSPPCYDHHSISIWQRPMAAGQPTSECTAIGISTTASIRWSVGPHVRWHGGERVTALVGLVDTRSR